MNESTNKITAKVVSDTDVSKGNDASLASISIMKQEDFNKTIPISAQEREIVEKLCKQGSIYIVENSMLGTYSVALTEKPNQKQPLDDARFDVPIELV